MIYNMHVACKFKMEKRRLLSPTTPNIVVARILSVSIFALSPTVPTESVGPNLITMITQRISGPGDKVPRTVSRLQN